MTILPQLDRSLWIGPLYFDNHRTSVCGRARNQAWLGESKMTGTPCMADEAHAWNEKEWQDHVNRILIVHYHSTEHTYQVIPDKVQGDGGLEGFATNGHVYQCYCDQDTVNTGDRTRKQKKKITADLGKLDKYKTYWSIIFKDLKITRWVLVVPNHEDKAVIKHAIKRAAVLAAKGLPFIDPAFIPIICTDCDGFPEAYQKVIGCGASRVNVSGGEVDQSAVAIFASQTPTFVRNLDVKLNKVLPDRPGLSNDPGRAALQKDLLTWYLKGSTILKKIEQKAPVIYERILKFTQEQAASISTESKFDDSAARPRLKDARRDLEKSLGQIAMGLDDETLTCISWGTVASWLGNCPLDFPEV